MTMVLKLLWLILLALLPLTYATLSCQSEASGVAALHATCMADVGCRWFYSHYSPEDFADLVTRRLQIVRDDASASLALQSAYHGDDDVRHFFQPPSWLTSNPAMVGVSSSSADATTDCLAVAANLANVATSSLPPLELMHALLVLVNHAVFLSDDRMCDPESEVAAIDPDTKITYCMVVENRICSTSTGIDSGLATAVMIGIIVVLCLVVLVVVVGSVMFFRNQRNPVNQQQSLRANTKDEDDTQIELDDM